MSVHSLENFGRNERNSRLQRLSDEVSKIAASLDQLSRVADEEASYESRPSGPPPSVSAELVKATLRARRLRERYFDADLFADPAWDILLELLHADLCQYRVSVSSLCIAAHVPATTALRWITGMTDSGLLIRNQDPFDGRRMFIELSKEAKETMRRYFASLEGPASD